MEESSMQDKAIPFDILQTIFGLVSSHERRFSIPLVCKGWLRSVAPPLASPILWREVEVRDGLCQGRPTQSAAVSLQQRTETIIRWLWERREVMSTLEVFLAPSDDDSSVLVARWCEAFGLALPVLRSSTTIKGLIIRGPGAVAVDPSDLPVPYAGWSAAQAAGTLLHGAFSLSSLESLRLYDVPWINSLQLATSIPAAPSQAPSGRLNLVNLRELTINRSFHSGVPGQAPAQTRGSEGLLDGGAAEAWEALGRALAALPHLARLDLAYTYAMTYCDPARGAAAAAWPPLKQLRELCLSHDLSVQPPPPPPPPPRQATGDGAIRAPKDAGSTPGIEASFKPVVSELDSDCWTQVRPSGSNGRVPPLNERSSPQSSSSSAAAQGFVDARIANDVIDGIKAAGPDDGPLYSEFGGELGCELGGSEGVIVNLELAVTVDAAHAAVELLTWLPTCTALASLDLRHCGLEAVPLAIVHLPCLDRLDLYGNPLVTMRLPGPLGRLAWLRFSLDPCYDILYDQMVGEAGAAVAAEEMLAVEVPAPQLKELEVDSTSARALGLIREAAAATLPHLRRLTLVDKSDMALVA